MIPPHLLERLPLIADGNPGAHLREQHRNVRGVVEALNLRRPEWVQAAHDAYFQAGARLLRTNTASASRLALAAEGFDDRCEAIHNTGMALLRAAVGQQALAAGCIGEIVMGSAPEREEAYGQQLVYLCDTGADLILLDGFTSAAEASRVRRLALGAGDAPVLALLHVTSEGRLPDGQSLAEAARALAGDGVDAVAALITPAVGSPGAVLAALQSGPLPTGLFFEPAPGGTLSPDEFAQRLVPWVREGVHILGGGRGVTPEHIRALTAQIAQQRG